jgi:hypothetical protein
MSKRPCPFSSKKLINGGRKTKKLRKLRKSKKSRKTRK